MYQIWDIWWYIPKYIMLLFVWFDGTQLIGVVVIIVYGWFHSELYWKIEIKKVILVLCFFDFQILQKNDLLKFVLRFFTGGKTTNQTIVYRTKFLLVVLTLVRLKIQDVQRDRPFLTVDLGCIMVPLLLPNWLFHSVFASEDKISYYYLFVMHEYQD